MAKMSPKGRCTRALYNSMGRSRPSERRRPCSNFFATIALYTSKSISYSPRRAAHSSSPRRWALCLSDREPESPPG
jgi:hypothetical protein